MSDRTRCWTFIIYPESAPDNFIDILEELHIEWLLSPLHDKDLNPDGEEKKAHYHCVLSFSQVKSYAQVEEITKSVNGTIPLKVHNMRSMVRYLIHLDNPEKYQYNRAEIRAFGGLNINDMLEVTTTEAYDIIGQIREYVQENDIVEYTELYDYIYINRPEWIYTINTFNSIIHRYMQGLTFRKKQDLKEWETKLKNREEELDKLNAELKMKEIRLEKLSQIRKKKT